jgi:hypothetical protein
MHRTEWFNAPAQMFCVHEIGILALDFANENARISKLALECGGLRLSARELPNLHACSSAHVERQYCVPRMYFVAGIPCHQCRFSGFFKHSYVNAKSFSVPSPSLVHIWNTDSNLLDATDKFLHKKGCEALRKYASKTMD